MADKKVSELVEATSAALADVFLVVQSGTSKRITKANLFKLFETADVVGQILSRKTHETLSASSAISATLHHTFIDNSLGNTLAFTLAAGVEGMTKTVALKANAGAEVIVVTVTDGLGFTTFSLTNVGDSVTLHFVNGTWVVVGKHGAIIA